MASTFPLPCLPGGRPWGYGSRFQAPVETIRQSLSNKLARVQMEPCLAAFPPAPLAQGPAAAGEPIPGIKLV
ncbi:hypothetical protein DFAR_1110083 [Desulfarculales bacterium]